MNDVTPYEVEKYLAGVEYPTTKEQLAQAAEENGAPADVISTLQRLPAGEIDSPEELTALFGDATGDEDESNRDSDEALGEIGTGDDDLPFHKE